MKLRLNKSTLETLRRLGVQGLSIIEFDEHLGPVPKFVYSKHSRLIRRILRDRIFSSKVSILAKYACEARLIDDLHIVVESFESYGRRLKTNYIIAQLSEDANIVRIRQVLRRLKRRLDGCREIRKDIIERYLMEIL